MSSWHLLQIVCKIFHSCTILCLEWCWCRHLWWVPPKCLGLSQWCHQRQWEFLFVWGHQTGEITPVPEHSLVIQILFVEHSDEPNASTLYLALSNAQSNASASVGEIIDICSALNDDIFPKVSALFSTSHVRFKTTYTVFLHFFLKVSKSLVCTGCHAKFKQ